MNKYRKGEGERPGRIFRPHASEILRFCRRPEGGRQREALVDALVRLSTTHIHMERTRVAPNGRTIVESKGESLINNYRVIGYKETGKVNYIEIEIPRWIYQEVMEAENPDVLTVHSDFFLIDPGIGRFLYRLARRAAGKGQAKWAFKTLYERSGSTEFCGKLRRLINSNDLQNTH